MELVVVVVMLFVAVEVWSEEEVDLMGEAEVAVRFRVLSGERGKEMSLVGFLRDNVGLVALMVVVVVVG